ncbi:MAG: hypothetical protein R3C32_11765 [Chloroflexota bacterium]
MAASGSLLAVWFRDRFAPGVSFADLDLEASRVPPGSEGLVALPYFLGEESEKTPLFDPYARGTIVGPPLAPWPGPSSPGAPRGHLVRVPPPRRWLRELGTHPGARPVHQRRRGVDAVEAGHRGRPGAPLEQVADHPGSSLGAAFVAGKGVGTLSTGRRCAGWVGAAHTEPDPGRAE